MLVYVAVLKDNDLSVDEVLAVKTDKEMLSTYVKDYFGISETKTYNKVAKYLGYTKIEYSEFEDDLEGYFTFDDDGEICKVYVFCKVLDEKI
jgi:hypothetical protein